MKAELTPTTGPRVTVSMTLAEAKQLHLLLGGATSADVEQIVGEGYDPIEQRGNDWVYRLYDALDIALEEA